MSITESQILEVLATVEDTQQKGSIVALGMVSDIQVINGRDILFAIEVDPARGPSMEDLRQQAENAVSGLPGVEKVTAILTAEKKASPQAQPDPHGMNKNPPLKINARHIIAVASGKGGVGKSTVAVNLATSLSRAGKKIGLLDADIYGPSVPLLTGIVDQKPIQKNNKIEPINVRGMQAMSIGLMMDQEAPLIWRGPMVQTAIYQMLRDVAWGSEDQPLDILVIDMPPGTGDAQLTLAQKVPVTGAVIVSTPQDLSLIDARKAIEMFDKTNVPVLGIIENMSTHICSQCGHEEAIFGQGGAQQEAEKRGVSFLGEIPLNITIREQSDQGQPVDTKIFSEITNNIIDALE